MSSALIKLKSESQLLHNIIHYEASNAGVSIAFEELDESYMSLNEILIEHRGSKKWFRVYFRDPNDYNKISCVFQKIGDGELISVLSVYVPSVSMYKFDLISIFNEWVIADGDELVIEGYLTRFD